MNKKSSIVYLEHILESIFNIEQFLLNCNKEILINDRMRYDDILRNLQIMPESVQRLPTDLKDLHPNIT